MSGAKRLARGAALLAFALAAGSAFAAEPSLILRGGKVFLGPGRFAQAVAVAGNRITDVGADADVLKLKGPKTTVVDLHGRLVAPGLHDAHAEFLEGALASTEVDLRGAGSISEAAARIAQYAAAHPDDAWILGRGWDQALFAEERWPTREDLDTVLSTRPVAVTDVDGRSLWLNSEALRLCRITKLTPKLNKGEIVHDSAGQPTGVLRDEAMGLATRSIPRRTREETLDALRKALELARSHGVTAIDALPPDGRSPDELVDLWRQLYKSGQTTLRLFVYARLDDLGAAVRLRKAESDIPRTRFGLVGVQDFMDGTLYARTAALLEPYFDEPKQRGAPLHLQWRLGDLVGDAHAQGFQVALHAAGDRAVRLALDACEKSEQRAKSKGYVLPRYPCRVEGADLVAPDDLPRFAALSVAVSMQPARLAFPDQQRNYIPNRAGDRARGAFAWRALEQAGALVVFGTGWPVQPLDPAPGFYEAVTRRALDGKPEQGWIPQERIAPEAALQHWTLDAARAVGRDEELGSIKPGKLADLAVFSSDVLAPDADLLHAGVDLTVYDGRVVYQRGE